MNLNEERIRHARSKVGNIIREITLRHNMTHNGCECESVTHRDAVKSASILQGMPTLPCKIGKLGLDLGGIERGVQDYNGYAQKFDIRFGDDDGQAKLGLLLTSLWRWDEICVYFGASPGNNLDFISTLRGFAGRQLILVDPRPLDDGLVARLKKRGWRVFEILGAIPDVDKTLVSALIKMFRCSGTKKVLFFSDIRTDTAVALGKNANDWSMAFDEDRLAIFSVASYVNDLRKNFSETNSVEFRCLLKM